MKKQIIIGNWKMYKTNSTAVEFIKNIEKQLELNENMIAGVAVPSIMLSDVKKATTKLVVAAQNCYFEKEGAFTGEISVPMLSDLGIKYCVIGHSERREIFKETDQDINNKAKALLAANIIPVLCCGESLSTYEQGKTIDFVKEQITKGFANISADDAKKVVIAYEPIWAIGTGKVATPEIAQNVCKEIRNIIKGLYNEQVAQEILIQYGGSVKPDNIKDILSQEDIDGALVGGASLVEESYLGLIK